MEVTRKELRKNDILNRGLLGDVVSGDSAADQMEELQAQMGSPKTPQQNIALGEAYAKPRPFTPDARYYPNVGGQTFPSPAQAYMAEVAAARAAEEAKSGPGPTTDPYAALKAGLIAGEGTAQDRSQGNAISGLLGDINWKGLMDKLLQTFQRPEMLTPGVNALTSFGMSGAALNQAEIAGAAAKQDRMDKIKLEQIKNAPVAPKPSAEITNLYKEMGTYQTGLNTFDRIKGILSKGIGTGAAGTALSALNNIAAAFNINLTPSAQKSVNLAVAEIRTQLIASRAYGREANKDEQKLIRALIPEAGTFSTIKELEEAYGLAADAMKRKANETNAIMTGVYGLLPYGSVVRNTPLYTRNAK